MSLVLEIAPFIGVLPACDALEVSRATFYRRQEAPKVMVPRQPNPRTLTAPERARLLEILCSERFMDASPAQVHAAILDEGVHLASVSTMYRILRSVESATERRTLRRHPVYTRPELSATRPNQLWSWDITKIQGPDRRQWFHLYVILDVFSRKVVGWRLEAHETGELAGELIAAAVAREGVERESLTLHADRGTSMKSKTVAELLEDLGVKRSHSRPRVSDDNPFSEAQFKTLKYSPYFPGTFKSLLDGRQFLHIYFSWYNEEHHHSGIAMLTPDTVHSGRVDAVLAIRQKALDKAYNANPERFSAGRPVVKGPPKKVWINRPTGQVTQLDGVDGLPSAPQKAENAPTEARPTPAGSPARASHASEEGVAAVAEPTRRVTDAVAQMS